jgi:hypothetical protein
MEGVKDVVTLCCTGMCLLISREFRSEIPVATRRTTRDPPEKFTDPAG